MEIIPKEFVELEEHYEEGRCVRRLLNGVEVDADEFASVVQFAPCVTTKTKMTYEEAKHKYGHLSNFPAPSSIQ